ncbi:MAG: S8 family peptidase [Verrucomicrobiota bacterium]
MHNQSFASFIFVCCLGAFFQPVARAESTANIFHFRTPLPLVFWVENASAAKGIAGQEWISASVGASTNRVELGNRIAIQLQLGTELKSILMGRSAKWSRTVAPGVFILQTADALTSSIEADAMARLPGVLASYPVMRRPAELHGPYARKPNDRYFSGDSSFLGQWNLENRSPTTGLSAGADINVRAAWPFSLGEGVTVAVADTGVELSHVELTNQANGTLHFNFADQSTNTLPARSAAAAHGTEVAGLILAQSNNGRGIAGVAPKAHLASWAIFSSNLLLASDEHLMDMYQYASNAVAVQNHSWGNSGRSLARPGLLESIGISNAVTFGRFGRGGVMVRSAGNGRLDGANSNDDGYPSDPRVIAVAGVGYDGRFASYSEPGACLLVAAPSGEIKTRLFTTDLIGTAGANAISFRSPFEDLSDYAFDIPGYDLGFSGTSAAAPEIAGIAALMISANTNLTYRDVQQILIFSARHFDFDDPDLATNGAGFHVSHNLGFGVPDAGYAVRLAKNWPLRPAKTNLLAAINTSTAIPDGGLRVLVSGDNLPAALASIAAAPSLGPHADSPTAILPLVNVGLVTNSISLNLTNKGALIQHGTNSDYTFEITKAAQAGAAFAVVFFYSDDGVPSAMLGTDYVPIPAVIIGQTKGAALRNYLQTNTTATAQIRLNVANFSFNIPETLACEHVGLHVSLNHPSRADLRITLLSPQGTRSVLQRVNGDIDAAPTDWTFWSTHHFYESSAGTWTVSVSDEFPGLTGSVQGLELIINGVAIADTDHDGLDDNWELAHFGSLAANPKDDPDKDGNNNAREQILQTDPNAPDVNFQLDLSSINENFARLSWPSSEAFSYEVQVGSNVASLGFITNVVGKFPETEWITRYTNSTPQFFRVRAVPKP